MGRHPDAGSAASTPSPSRCARQLHYTAANIASATGLCAHFVSNESASLSGDELGQPRRHLVKLLAHGGHQLGRRRVR